MKKRTALAIGGLIVFVIIGAVAWVILSGMLVITWNGFNTRYSSVQNVCGSDIVEEYNKASSYEYRGDDATEPTMDVTALNNVTIKIKERSGYSEDPTCQVMLFWNAYENNEIDQADQALKKLKDLHEMRAFPDNNLSTSVPFYQYEESLEYIKNLPESE